MEVGGGTQSSASALRIASARIESAPAASTLPPAATTVRRSTDRPNAAMAIVVSVPDVACIGFSAASGIMPWLRAAIIPMKPIMNHGTR